MGDELFGELAGYRGGLAELVCTRPELLTRKPDRLSFAEASTIPQAGGIARRATADVRPGDRVLVNGAGGAGGVFVVALAKHAGAEVTAVDRADKSDFLREIGADRTIDFAAADWADERDSFDLVVDLVAHRSPFRVHRALRRGGRYAMVGGQARILLGTAIAGPLVGRATGTRVGVLVVPQSRAELEAVTALRRSGRGHAEDRRGLRRSAMPPEHSPASPPVAGSCSTWPSYDLVATSPNAGSTVVERERSEQSGPGGVVAWFRPARARTASERRAARWKTLLMSGILMSR